MPPTAGGRSVFLIVGLVLMAQRQTYLTPEGFKSLEQELEHLKTARRKEVAARIRKASESGGTVDNAEYDQSKNEQAFVEGRITDLETIVSNAVVASKKDRSSDAVAFGSSVKVVTDQGAKRRYKVVGSTEADPLRGKISMESPVGQALMDSKVGDKVEVQAPSGVVTLTILEIR